MFVDMTVNDRVAMQPETEHELRALRLLFEQVSTCWMTIDVPDYPDLDAELWETATFDPRNNIEEPGSRALIVATGPGRYRVGGGFV